MPVLTFGFQPSCPFCAEVKPRVEALARKVPKVRFEYVDITRQTFPVAIGVVPAFHLRIGEYEKTWEAGNENTLPSEEAIAAFVLKGWEESRRGK